MTAIRVLSYNVRYANRDDHRFHRPTSPRFRSRCPVNGATCASASRSTSSSGEAGKRTTRARAARSRSGLRPLILEPVSGIAFTCRGRARIPVPPFANRRSYWALRATSSGVVRRVCTYRTGADQIAEIASEPRSSPLLQRRQQVERARINHPSSAGATGLRSH